MGKSRYIKGTPNILRTPLGNLSRYTWSLEEISYLFCCSNRNSVTQNQQPAHLLQTTQSEHLQLQMTKPRYLQLQTTVDGEGLSHQNLISEVQVRKKKGKDLNFYTDNIGKELFQFLVKESFQFRLTSMNSQLSRFSSDLVHLLIYLFIIVL